MSFPDTQPSLRARRIELRPLGDGDVPALFEVYGDPRVLRYWSHTAWTTAVDAELLLARHRTLFAEQRAMCWGVFPRDAGALIGTCSLFAYNAQNRRCEIGYILGHAHWGHGYMNEALEALLEYAFGPLALHRVEADIDPRNVASLRAVERLGFLREGLLRERWWVEREVSDTALMGLLRGDWERRATRPG